MALYFPRHLNVETSDYCNRSCAFCPLQHARDRSPPRLLDPALFEKLCRELGDSELDVKLSLQWVDEPLANPDFFDYVDRGRALAPDVRWLLQTNGDFLDEDKLAQLKPRFDAVVVNLYSASARRRLDKLDLDFVPARFPKRLQSPGRLQRATGFEDRRDEAVVHLNEKFHDEDWVQWHDEDVEAAPPCSRVWEDASIAWDGTVYLCCRDNHRDHPVGHLAEETLFEAFNSDRARAVREKMEDGKRHELAMCRACEKSFAGRYHALDDATASRLAGAPRAAAVVVGERKARRPEDTRLPWGRYDYFTARSAARALGHAALPGLLPRRYEVVVGVTPDDLRRVREVCRDVAGEALIGLVVCGGRVMTRQRLALVDPSVFLYPVGPLRVGRKAHLREHGRDPARSSDLDLKVLVRDDLIGEEDAAAGARELGRRLDELGLPIPISGHKTPLIRLLRVPSSCADARAAFDAYNASRVDRTGKGPLSLQYSQLLWDRADPHDPLDDPTAPVRELLRRADDPELVELPLDAITGSDDPRWAAPESHLYREANDPLSYHQLVIALLDFPELEPPGVAAREGHLVAGALGARAARAAGRATVRVTDSPRS